jgi:hypothetical protein
MSLRLKLSALATAGVAALSGTVALAAPAQAATCTVGPTNSLKNDNVRMGYRVGLQVYHLQNCASHTTLATGSDTYHAFGWGQVGAVYVDYNWCAELGYTNSAGRYVFVDIIHPNTKQALTSSVNYTIAPYRC